MFTSLPIEDTVLLTFILIEAAIVVFILLRLRGTLRGGIRKLRRAAFFSCLLAVFVLAAIAILHIRDQFLGLDDDPPPNEIPSIPLTKHHSKEGSTTGDIARILAKIGL